MSPATDSLAQLATELAKLLEPLSALAVPSNTPVFFAELGITLTDAQAATLGAPLSALVSQTDELLSLVPEMLTALSSDQYQTVIADTQQAVSKVPQTA